MNTTRNLARVAAHAGLPALAWHVRRARGDHGRALILMYHRVADDVDFLGRCVPPALFEQQLDLLCRRVRVLPLVELAERLHDPTPLPESVAAITFDDGFRDNLETAGPILARRQLPATVFVTTDFVDGCRRPIGDRLRDAFDALWQQGAEPQAWPESTHAVDRLVRDALATPRSLAMVRKLDLCLKNVPCSERERVVGDVEQLAASAPHGPSLMLDWHAVRCLAESGVEIASHTVSHPILSRVPLDRAEHELRASKERIEAEIGRPVRGFAFPNGHEADFTSDHVSILRRLGYAYACTAERGGNRPGGDPYRLRRIGIGRDSRALLDMKLAFAGAAEACAA